MRNLCFIAVAIFFSTNLVHGGPYSIDCYDSREALKFIPPDWEPPEGPYVRTAEGPPASPAEGQSSLWYLWYFGGGPPHSESHQCTIRGGNDSDNVWVVVDDRIWNVSIDQTDVDLIIENFDNSSPGPLGTGIYDIDTNAFGDVPLGYDNHPKVYLLYYEFNISSDGFFWYFDTEEDGTYPYGSNELMFRFSSAIDPTAYLDNISAVVEPIPEPSTFAIWSLLGLSCIGVGWWRKRRAA